MTTLLDAFNDSIPLTTDYVGNYTFTAKDITLAQTPSYIEEIIGGIDNADVYKFTISTQSNLNLGLYAPSGLVKANLLNASGVDLAVGLSSNGTAQYGALSLAAGTYYLRVTPGDSSVLSRYRLQFSAIPPASVDNAGNTTGVATPIPVDSTTYTYQDSVGFRDSSGIADVDFYTFTVTGPAILNASLLQLVDDANIELLSGGGGKIQESVNTGTANESISRILSAGTYYLRVFAGTSTAVTSYTLDVNVAQAPPDTQSGNDLNSASLISAATTVLTINDFVGVLDANDYYKFDLAYTTTVNLALDNLTANADLELRRLDGSLIQGSLNAGTTAEQIRQTLNAGTYIVRVFPGGSSDSTNYSLRINLDTPPADLAGNTTSTSFVIPNTSLGSNPLILNDFIGQGDTNDFYRVDLGSRSVLSASLSGLAANADLQILNGAGTTILSSTNASNANESIRRQLDAGTYYVRVFPNSSTDYTNYNLTLTATPDNAGNTRATALGVSLGSATQILSDVVGDRDLANVADVDFYALTTGTSKASLNLVLSDLSADANVELLNSGGTVIQRSINAGTAQETINQILDANSTYYVRIFAANSTDITSYTLSLVDTAPIDLAGNGLTPPSTDLQPRLVSVGSTTVNVTDYVGQVDVDDYYKFTITPGDRRLVNILLDGLSANADVQLLSDTGVVIQESTNTGNAADKISRSLEAGNYYLHVFSAGAADNTNYTLRVSSSFDGGGNSLGQAVTRDITADLYATSPTPPVVISDAIGGGDANDYYKFDLNRFDAQGSPYTSYNFNLLLNSVGGTPSTIELLDSRGTVITTPPITPGASTLSFDRNLDSGTYYVHIGSSSPTSISYDLQLQAIPDRAGNSLGSALQTAFGTGDRVFSDFVGDGDRNDYYKVDFSGNNLYLIDVAGVGNFGTTPGAAAKAITGDLNVEVLDSSGGLITRSANTGTSLVTSQPIVESATGFTYPALGNVNESLELGIVGGTAYTRVYQGVSGAASNYDLQLIVMALPQISISGTQVQEGNTALLTVSLSTPVPNRYVQVFYQTVSGTASAGSDFTPEFASLIFAPGVTTRTISIDTIDDFVVDAGESFNVNLVSASVLSRTGQASVTLPVTTATGTVSIQDNDQAPPTASIDDVTLLEGNAGSTTFRFTVTLSAVSNNPITIGYSTRSGTALAGSDFTSKSGTLTFAAGVKTQTIDVQVTGDQTFETDETFFVDLSNGTNVTLDKSVGKGTISNDDTIDTPGNNSPTTAVPINLAASDAIAVSEFVGQFDLNDYYRLELADRAVLSLSLGSLQANADLQLFNGAGTAIQLSSNAGTTAESISRSVAAGTYYVRVFDPSASPTAADNTTYSLVITTDPDQGANTLASAGNLPGFAIATPVLLDDSVGSADPNDYYKFTLPSTFGGATVNNYSVQLGLTAPDNSGTLLRLLDSSGNVITSGATIDRALASGATYYVRVQASTNTNADYSLSVLSNPDRAGNTTTNADTKLLKTLPATAADLVGQGDTDDYYKFTLSDRSVVNLSLGDLRANADVQLLDKNGNVLFSSTNTGTTAESLSRSLEADSYYVRVFASTAADNTRYTLNLSTVADLGANSRTVAAASSSILPGTISDSVGSNDPNDFYKIVLTTSGILNLNLSGLAANADLQLLDSTGAILLSSTNTGTTAESIVQSLDAATYFVRVLQATSSDNTDYTLSAFVRADEGGNTAASAGALTGFAVGTPVTVGGSIGGSDANDYYKFTLPAPGTGVTNYSVNLSFDPGSGTGSSLQLLNSAGTVISSGALIDRALTAGTYLVRVSSGAATSADYSLTVSANSDPAGNTPTTAKLIDLAGGTVTESDLIGALDTNDYYKFVLTERSTVSLSLAGLTANATLRLLNSAGGLIQESANAGTANEVISFSLEASTNPYYVRIFPATGTENTVYTLTANAIADTGANSRTATPMRQLNLAVDADVDFIESIGNGDANDFYKITLASRQILNLSLTELTGNADLRLLNSAGTVIASSSNAGTASESISRSLDAGDYYVRILPATTSDSSSYRLQTSTSVDFGGNTFAAPTILASLPNNVSDSVGSNDPNDYYRVTLTSNGILNIGLAGLSADANIQLLDNIGNILQSSTNVGTSDESISRSLDAGNYYVRVFSPTGSNPTDYNLSLFVGNDFGGNTRATATLLTQKTFEFTDAIGGLDTNDFYRLDLAGTTDYNFAVTLTPDAGSTATLRLLNGTGTVLATGADLARPLAPGTYYLQVSSSSATGFSYSLNYDAQLDGAGDSLGAAQDITAIIAPPSNLDALTYTLSDMVGRADMNDYYTFTLGARKILNLSLTDLGANANLAILNSAGTVIFSSTQDGTTGEAINQSLEAGKYYIRVFAATTSDNTSYSLEVSSSPDEGGNTLGNPTNIKDVVFDPYRDPTNTAVVVSDTVSGSDPFDYYRFVLPADPTRGTTSYNFNLLLNSSATGAQVRLLDYRGSEITLTQDLNLDAGTYYVEVSTTATTPDPINYDLQLFAVQDRAGNSIDKALNIALDSGTLAFSDFIGGGDPSDYYKLTMPSEKKYVAARLYQRDPVTGQLVLSTDAKVEVQNSAGGVLIAPSTDNLIDFVSIGGDFYFRVFPSSPAATANYTLVLTKIDPPADNAPNTRTTARAIAVDGTPQTVSDFISPYDTADFYKFTVTSAGTLFLDVDGLTDPLRVSLLNSDGTSAGVLLRNLGDDFVSSTKALTAGTYYIRVAQDNTAATTYYNLQTSFIAQSEVIVDPEIDNAGNTLPTAREIGVSTTAISYTDVVSNQDKEDYYKFTLNSSNGFSLALSQLTNNVDVELLDKFGGVITSSNNGGVANETINVNLGADTYYIRVVSADNQNASYKLTVKTIDIIPPPPTAEFDVGDTIPTAFDVGVDDPNPNDSIPWSGYGIKFPSTPGQTPYPSPPFSITQKIGSVDNNDFYRIDLPSRQTNSGSFEDVSYNFNLAFNPTGDATVRLLDSRGTVIPTPPITSNQVTQSFNRNLDSGTYYVQVQSGAPNEITYNLQLFAVQDRAGNAINQALDTQLKLGQALFSDYVGPDDLNDYFEVNYDSAGYVPPTINNVKYQVSGLNVTVNLVKKDPLTGQIMTEPFDVNGDGVIAPGERRPSVVDTTYPVRFDILNAAGGILYAAKSAISVGTPPASTTKQFVPDNVINSIGASQKTSSASGINLSENQGTFYIRTYPFDPSAIGQNYDVLFTVIPIIVPAPN